MNQLDKKLFLSETVDFNNKAKELLLNKEVPVFIADTCWIKKRFIEKQESLVLIKNHCKIYVRLD